MDSQSSLNFGLVVVVSFLFFLPFVKGVGSKVGVVRRLLLCFILMTKHSQTEHLRTAGGSPRER